MCKNKLIIAAAGSGKTTYLVEEALKIKDQNVLVTTFTDANEQEIRKKFTARTGGIPRNVTVQTWFSFLIQHGVKPYQGGIFEKRVNGLSLVPGQSKKFTKKTDVEKYYFDNSQRIYSDKISAFVVKCDQEHNNEVIGRISRISPNIFIDEVQDLAGHDLEVLKLLLDSTAKIILVGDPRQGTYSTNNSAKNKQYKKAQIACFFESSKIKKKLHIDSTTLTTNYRSNQQICDFANGLFPEHVSTSSGQTAITGHDGIFFVRENDIVPYLEEYSGCIQLRDSIREKRPKMDYETFNFGNSKGLSFDRVLIYPTNPIMKWIKDNSVELAPTSRSKFYVAVTRARHSVGIVYNFDDTEEIEGINNYVKEQDC